LACEKLGLLTPYFRLCRPGLRSRYSDSLRAGQFGYRIPVGGRDFLHTSRPAVGPTQPPVHTGSFPAIKQPELGIDSLPHEGEERV